MPHRVCTKREAEQPNPTPVPSPTGGGGKRYAPATLVND
nr:MAG TPA: hypothetical protein [Caudoviricetes sp.]